MQHLSEAEAPGRIGALYAALWRHAGPDRKLVVLYLLLLVGAQVTRLAIPFYSGLAVNDLQAGALDAASRDMGLIFAACVAGWALHGPGRVVERFVALRVRERYADWLAAGILARPLRWHEARHSGDTIARAQKAAAALLMFAQHQFVYVQNGVSLVGPIVAICLISWATGLAALAGYALIGLVLLRFDRVMMRLAQRQNRAEARYAAALTDALSNVATVLALRLEASAREGVARRLAQVAVPQREAIVANEAKWCAIDLLNNGLRCGLAVLFAFLAWRATGSLALGAAVMVFQYAQQVGNVVGSMASHWQDLVRFATDFAGAAHLPAEDGPPRACERVDAWRTLRVEQLDFAYARGAGISLSGLELRRGCHVALVGESGSGKSTLLRLLAGLYEAEGARLRLDGAPIDAAGLHAFATLVPQTPEIFEASLLENLTMGREVPLARVLAACETAELTSVIAGLPQGLATPLGERGANLSGGQKQRVALARAILAADPAGLLLLDEPTSSLDPETEARLYEKLAAAFPEACIVSSIHRPHLLWRFDEVIEMAAGRVVERRAVPLIVKETEAPQLAA